METEEISKESGLRKPYPSIRESFVFVLFYVIGVIVAIPFYLLRTYIGEGLSILLMYVVSVGLPFIIVYKIKQKHEDGFKFNYRLLSGKIIFAAILVTIAIDAGISGPIVDLMPKDWMSDYMNMFSDRGVFTFITLVIIAPILEELIFRGIILDGLLQRYKAGTSIIISSLIFGIIHFDPIQAFPAFMGGLFLGWVYYKSRSVGVTILLHAMINLLAFMGLYFSPDNVIKLHTGYFESYGGVVWFVVLVVVSLAVATGGVWWLNGKFERKNAKIASEFSVGE